MTRMPPAAFAHAAPAPAPVAASPVLAPPAPAEEEDPLDAGLVRMDDRAAAGEPGPSVRDLLVRELGASLLEEIQDSDG
jgi:hypothetical protein